MSKNLIWCPIDLPKCPEFPNLNATTFWHFWNFMKITESSQTAYGISFIKNDVLLQYPNLVQWFRMFPYKTIRNIKLNQQVKEVKPHIDFTKPELDPHLYNNNQQNEPCGYRVLLRGGRKNKLYVVNKDVKIYCEMPDDTDVYVLGHTSTMHGVDQDEDRLTFFLHFEIDPERHQSLIEKSLVKYSKYAIYENT